MRLEHYPVEKLKREILTIVGHYLNLNEYHVFFFGSRVSKRSDERSDIDVGIEGPAAIPVEVMGNISDELKKLPILYKIEAVDFKKVPSDFRKIAMQAIEPISHTS
jgi:predicted nucleotidyltransferase